MQSIISQNNVFTNESNLNGCGGGQFLYELTSILVIV